MLLTSGTAFAQAGSGTPDDAVSVVLPTEITAFINPYRLPLSAEGSGTVQDIDFASGVVSPTYYIENNGTDDLSVSVVAAITPGGGVTVSETPFGSRAEDKRVFAYLNTTANEVDGKPLFSDTSYTANDNQTVFRSSGVKTDGIMVIKSGSKGYFRVEGESAENPSVQWNAGDTVTMSLIFDFTPVHDIKDVTLKEISGGSLAAAVTADSDTYMMRAEGSGGKDIAVTVTAPDQDTAVKYSVNGAAFEAASGDSVKGRFIIPKPVADYSEGDVLSLIVSNGEYSKTYTIMFTA